MFTRLPSGDEFGVGVALLGLALAINDDIVASGLLRPGSAAGSRSRQPGYQGVAKH